VQDDDRRGGRREKIGDNSKIPLTAATTRPQAAGVDWFVRALDSMAIFLHG
jgi:hypothetical protein